MTILGSDAGKSLGDSGIHEPGKPKSRPSRRFAWQLVVVVLLLVAAIGTGGWFYFKSLRAKVRRAAEENLSAIADLKAEQIANWMMERRADADEALHKRLVRQFLIYPRNASDREELLEWITALRQRELYSTIILFDSQGAVRLAVPEEANLKIPLDAGRIHAALHARGITSTDLYRTQSNAPPRLDFLVPIGIKAQADQPADGVLLLSVEADRFLYPLVQSWPTPSSTAETLLVRREGDDVLFLNELRHRSDSALTLRLPINAESHLPASVAARGIETVMEGVDYRGIPVLAATRKIEGTPWFMVAKIDQAEVDAPLLQAAWATVLIAALLIGSSILTVAYLWRRQTLISAQRELAERIRAEKELKESEERFRVLATSARDAIVVVDNEGKTAFWNKAAEDVFGYSSNDVIGKEAHAFMIPRRYVDDYRKGFARFRESGNGPALNQILELVAIRKDGTEFPVDLSLSALRLQDKWMALGIVRDISERKRTEAVLREQAALLDAATDAIIVRTLDHQVIYWNAGAERLFGWKRAEVVGRRMDAWEQSLSHDFEAAHAKLLKDGHWSGELERTAKTGRRMTIFCHFTLLRDGQGQPNAYLAISADITEKKQLESQLRQAQKLESVGRLAGGVAHDFNNLLTVIMGYSNFLLEDLPQGSMRSDVEQIKKAAEQAVSLTQQLLAFSRKQILQPKSLDLNDLIADMHKLLLRLLGEDIDLLTVPGPGLGLVKADPGQIQQVIANLAVNARDALPEGGKLTMETANVEIDQEFVSRHPMGRTGSYVMMAISDNGIGMDEEIQAHIFEPFYTTKGRGKGTGLGLSTVYGIIKQSNGFIWVYSEPGKGTTFKIYFPRVWEQIEETREVTGGETGSHGSETVLIVEDAPPVRAFAARSLREKGYTVLEATDGLEAVHVAQEFGAEIHLVVADMIMPNLSGKELISRIRVTRPDIKALYVSGYTGDAISHHGILDSGIAFLQKPFTASDLARKVREVIDSKTRF
jgi:two-component system cell cycle sensor histidine kinase/response regulator CckA